MCIFVISSAQVQNVNIKSCSLVGYETVYTDMWVLRCTQQTISKALLTTVKTPWWWHPWS